MTILVRIWQAVTFQGSRTSKQLDTIIGLLTEIKDALTEDAEAVELQAEIGPVVEQSEQSGQFEQNSPNQNLNLKGRF